MKSLTIGIEATLAGTRGAERHGIYQYLKQLLQGFHATGGPHRFRLWFNSFHRNGCEGVNDFLAEVRGPSVTAIVSRFPNRLRERLMIPADWFTGPLDLFHSPNHLLPRLRRPRGIVTIHDLAFLRMTEDLNRLNPLWCTAIRQRSPHPDGDLAAYRARCDFFLSLRRHILPTLRRADGIVAVSEATARDLSELANVPKARIRVVPNGLTSGMEAVKDEATIREAKERVGVQGRYILYVGVLDPNKDLHTLLRAFARTSSAFLRDHQLVIAGPRNWFQPVLEEEADRQRVGSRIRFPGFVPEVLLPALYTGATVAVSPSPLEGFGLPVLEAMACGVPVIVADRGALPEVAGDAALRVPSGEPDALASEIERVAGDAQLSTDLVTRGFLRCRAFSWERTARMTLGLYEEVAG